MGTPDQEKDWTDRELENYIFSNGLIRPARRKGQKSDEPTKADWKILELEPGAEVAVVKKAYRRLALLHHPDKHQGEKEKAKAADTFRRLAMAYETVCGHVAEVPAMAATTEGSRKRKWRIVIVEA